ncbi:MAG: restriction endonuclease subunit S [Chloroflexota bacterium]
MNLVSIRDLVKKTRHLDPKKLGVDSFTYVDISSVDKDTKKIIEPQMLLVGDAPSRARKEIKADDVLVATVRPNLNGVAIVPAQYDNQIASTGFCILRTDTEQLDPNYLFYFTQTDYFISHLTELSTGAGYPAVSDEDILDTRIPLPPLTEQKRIASLLARADRLRALRRTAYELGESLLQSVFLEMFGDPIENTKHWQCFELGEIARVERGRFSPRPRNDPKYYGGKYPFIQTGDISASGGIVTQYSQTLNEFGIKVSKAFDIGTIVIAIVGATIGESAILGIKTYCPDSIIGITPNPKKCNSQYLNLVMQYWKPVFRAQAPETARANINIGIVKPIPIPVPPLNLQEGFAGVVARVESLRGRMSEAERQVEGLFESLLSESFG